MTDRSVVCIADDAPAHQPLFDEMRRAGWQPYVVPTFGAAGRLLMTHRFRVGLLLPGEGTQPASWDLFLRHHAGIEWTGVFDSRALQTPGWRSLILDHLFDHHTLPADSQRLLLTLGHALGRAALRPPTGLPDTLGTDAGIVGASPPIQTLLQQIKRMALTSAPVLIDGESGSGKELAALALQRASARAQQPFLTVHCGAIPAALMASELFGHVRGAFPGADRDKTGVLEAAHQGTVFLDEVGSLPMDVQTSLLRFLQNRVIVRQGSTSAIPLDVRVIAASPVSLEPALGAGIFRPDLYYRLKVLSLQVPALRERRGDIVLLAQHFFEQQTREHGSRLKGFSHHALGVMTAHDWPGNVRELMNRVRCAALMAEGRYITAADLGLAEPGNTPAAGEALGAARIAAERTAISASLDLSRKNVSQAARRLGVSRMTLYRLMAKHGISPG